MNDLSFRWLQPTGWLSITNESAKQMAPVSPVIARSPTTKQSRQDDDKLFPLIESIASSRLLAMTKGAVRNDRAVLMWPCAIYFVTGLVSSVTKPQADERFEVASCNVQNERPFCIP
jgi:hypothetical protein